MEEPVQGAMGGSRGACVCGGGAQDLHPVQPREGGETTAGEQDDSTAAGGGGQAEAAGDGEGSVVERAIEYTFLFGEIFVAVLMILVFT